MYHEHVDMVRIIRSCTYRRNKCLLAGLFDKKSFILLVNAEHFEKNK